MTVSRIWRSVTSLEDATHVLVTLLYDLTVSLSSLVGRMSFTGQVAGSLVRQEGPHCHWDLGPILSGVSLHIVVLTDVR